MSTPPWTGRNINPTHQFLGSMLVLGGWCSIPMNLCSPLRSPCCRPLRTRWRYGGPTLPTPSAWHRDNEWLPKIWEESIQPSLTWKKYVTNLNVRVFFCKKYVYIYNIYIYVVRNSWHSSAKTPQTSLRQTNMAIGHDYPLEFLLATCSEFVVWI